MSCSPISIEFEMRKRVCTCVESVVVSYGNPSKGFMYSISSMAPKTRANREGGQAEPFGGPRGHHPTSSMPRVQASVYNLGGQGQGLVALGVFAVLSSTYTTCMYH